MYCILYNGLYRLPCHYWACGVLQDIYDKLVGSQNLFEVRKLGSLP
jgi:hypothetical protein